VASAQRSAGAQRPAQPAALHRERRFGPRTTAALDLREFRASLRRIREAHA
jgi:hypothetical protein